MSGSASATEPAVAGPTRSPMSTRLDRPYVVAIIAFGLALVVAGVALGRAHGDVSRLVHAAPPWTDASHAPPSLSVGDTTTGFDGQFYYRLARAPFETRERVDGIAFDIPALRAERVGYPLLAGALSLGDPARLPWTLLGVNLAAMAALGWIAGGLARSSGRHALWGLLIVAWPGFVFSISFDLGEVVAMALVAGALLAGRQRRAVAAALLLCVAVLTRESTMVVPAALVLAAAWYPRDREQPLSRRGLLVAGVPPTVMFVAWQLICRLQWGVVPLGASGEKNVRLPFAGLVDQRAAFLPPTSSAAAFRLGALGLLVAGGVVTALCLHSSKAPRQEKIASVAAYGVLVVLSGFIWAGATSFLRAASEAWLLGCLVILAARWPRRVPVVPALAALEGALWVATVAKPV